MRQRLADVVGVVQGTSSFVAGFVAGFVAVAVAVVVFVAAFQCLSMFLALFQIGRDHFSCRVDGASYQFPFRRQRLQPQPFQDLCRQQQPPGGAGLAPVGKVGKLEKLEN